MPNKRQREIARLREYAALAGLFVEFRTVPGTDKRRSWGLPPVQGAVIYYGKRLRPQRGSRSRDPQGPRQSAWLWTEEGWRGLYRREPEPAALCLLPPQILAASRDEVSCGIYWQETGGVTQIDQISSALEQWENQSLA